MNIRRLLRPEHRATVRPERHVAQAPQAPRLLPTQREASVLALIAQKRWITVRELMNELHVSEATVRRDLDRLARRNLIIRLHGGAQWQEHH